MCTPGAVWRRLTPPCALYGMIEMRASAQQAEDADGKKGAEVRSKGGEAVRR